ncbi:MAG: HD domain-containing protein [Candidatus Woesearchaeota archaeon]
MKDEKQIVDFFFEVGQLKRVKRSGWWLVNIKDPESVAEHSFRTALIGYVLARLEGADTKKVVLECLFHNVAETRLNDFHKVNQRYIDSHAAKHKAVLEQYENLPVEASDELLKLFEELRNDQSKEAQVARDADLLETACQAKEYIEIGYKDAQNWIDNTWKIIKTESGKRLLTLIEKTNSNDWWHNLKKIVR